MTFHLMCVHIISLPVSKAYKVSLYDRTSTMAQMVHFLLNSEFAFRKKSCGRKFVFGDATSGSVHGVWQGIQN